MLPLNLTLAGWGVYELTLRVRERAQHRGGRGRDRGTRLVIVAAFYVAILGAYLVRSSAPSLGVPAGARAVGVVVIWVGIGIRVWAITVLGRSFRTTVEVDPDQVVVTRGPYRWVRHPSYTGLLLIFGGVGLAVGNWLALVICLALPPPALLWRIHVEEDEMVRVLGEPYRAYQTQTKRLIPGVW